MVALVFVGIMTPKQHCGSIYFIKDTGSYEMGHFELGVVLDAGDSYRQTVLTGLESALSRYV